MLHSVVLPSCTQDAIEVVRFAGPAQEFGEQLHSAGNNRGEENLFRRVVRRYRDRYGSMFEEQFHLEDCSFSNVKRKADAWVRVHPLLCVPFFHIRCCKNSA